MNHGPRPMIHGHGIDPGLADWAGILKTMKRCVWTIPRQRGFMNSWPMTIAADAWAMGHEPPISIVPVASLAALNVEQP